MSDTDPKEPAPKEPENEPEPKEPEQEPDFKAEAEKYKALMRKHEARAKENADAARRLQEIEDSKKSEIDRATDKATQAEQRATEAERKALRLEVALDKAPEGMPLSQVRNLAKRLAGSTQEELEADATELFEEFAPATGEKDDTSNRRPKERLKAGAAPETEPEENDPDKLAAKVPRMY